MNFLRLRRCSETLKNVTGEELFSSLNKGVVEGRKKMTASCALLQQMLSGQERTTGEGLSDGVDTLARILYELGGNEEGRKKIATVS